MSKIDDIVRERIESKPSFLATDGSAFSTRREAEDHEKMLWLRSEVSQLVGQSRETFAFSQSSAQNAELREACAAWVVNNAASLDDLFKTFYDRDEI